MLSTLNFHLSQFDDELNELHAQTLTQFVINLQKWNKVYNLTALKQDEDIVVKHLFDSLVILKHLPKQCSVIDVGTGAGFPGIPLAVARPESTFTLCDSNGKKTRFLNHLKSQLSLPNVNVSNERIEDISSPKADIIISRAYASIEKFIQSTEHLSAPGTSWFAMKGQLNQSELNDVPDGYEVSSVIELDVPKLDAERHLVIIRPKAAE